MQVADEMDEQQQLSMYKLIWLVLHKGTALGSESPSLLMSRAVSRVPEYAHQQSEAEEAAAPATVTKTKIKPRVTKTTPATADKLIDKKKKRTGRPRSRWPDKEGAKGPNGLPRKKGGNPAGVRCEYLDQPGGCGPEGTHFARARAPR